MIMPPYDQLISRHFRLSEFAQHPKPEWGEEFADGEPYPDGWIYERLTQLCEVLELIREGCGDRPMQVISGYRSVAYNAEMYRRAGRPPTDSQHSEGRAADIEVEGLPPGSVHAVALDLYRAKRIQIGGLGLYVGFVHVDTRTQVPAGHLAQWSGSRTREQTA